MKTSNWVQKFHNFSFLKDIFKIYRTHRKFGILHMILLFQNEVEHFFFQKKEKKKQCLYTQSDKNCRHNIRGKRENSNLGVQKFLFIFLQIVKLKLVWNETDFFMFCIKIYKKFFKKSWEIFHRNFMEIYFTKSKQRIWYYNNDI